jgi:hypothetical protein
MLSAESEAKLKPSYTLCRAHLFRFREHLRFLDFVRPLCLLHRKFCYVIKNIRYLENHVQIADRCAPWKFSADANNHVLQALQCQNLCISKCHVTSNKAPYS